MSIDKYPKITIVTPSLNQAQYLERTIQSVLDQGYPNLEYIIIDGGSTDGSVDIIKKYEKQLAYWVSEPDSGQSNAINKGLQIATGDWVGWQNSDDIYLSGSFFELAASANSHPSAALVTANMMLIDEIDRKLRDIKYIRPTYKSMIAEGMILANQAAFWKRTCHTDIGYLDENLHYAFDYEWFLRLTKHFDAEHTDRFWGGLRLHGDTKTSNQASRFVEENKKILLGREMSRLQIWIYKVIRLGIMLRKREIYYVARGLLRRVSGSGKKSF